jgi:ABC-2 type transport system ATP-binding protein
MGYLPETAPLYPEMTVAEYLGFCGHARGLSGRRLAERCDSVVADCGLESAWNRPIAHLSKGFRQRTGLAQALIHDPDILVLDEPTSGLDPLQILEIRRLIRELSSRKTILFSTHVLQEIDAVSDRVMIINEGRIIAQGTPVELQRRSMGDDRLVVEVEAPLGDVETALRGCAGVLGVDSVERPVEGVTRAVVRHAWGDESALRAVAALAVAKGWPLRRLAPERHSLERVFIELTRAGSASPEAAA